MDCKKFQELILTDYLDGELERGQKESLGRHLAQCRLCKEFSLSAQKVGDELFSHADRVDPPEFIWQQIEKTLLAEQQKTESLIDRLLKGLRNVLLAPRSIFAIASAMALILMIGTIIQTKISDRDLLNSSAQGQIEYFTGPTAGVTDVSQAMEAGYGTLVEEYFL